MIREALVADVPVTSQKCLLISINGKHCPHHFNVHIAPVRTSLDWPSRSISILSLLVRSPSREGTKAQKRLLISKLPQVLHVVLRRFRSLPQTNLRRPTSRQARQLSHKITMHVNFDEYLDMAPYCAQFANNASPSLPRVQQLKTSPAECLYRLRGVIVHYGKSINTGHFVAFVHNDTLGKSRWAKKRDHGVHCGWLLGEWLRCDDHVIEQTNFESVKTCDAYILVYSRCTPIPTPTAVVPSPPGETIEPMSERAFVERADVLLVATSTTCQLRKRKRAISVDHLNEPKEDPPVIDDGSKISTCLMNAMFVHYSPKTIADVDKENSEENVGLSKSLTFLCVNLGKSKRSIRCRLYPHVSD